MNQPVLGIIGGGQLGSMLSEAAKKIDIKTVVLSDDPDAPAKNFANKFIYGNYDDSKIITEFVDSVDLVTYEFENIPFDILNEINKNHEVNIFINVHFFGKNNKNINLINFYKKNNAWLINDCTHCLNPSIEFERFSDFSLYSPHKFYSIPSGAICKINFKGINEINKNKFFENIDLLKNEFLTELNLNSLKNKFTDLVFNLIWFLKRFVNIFYTRIKIEDFNQDPLEKEIFIENKPFPSFFIKKIIINTISLDKTLIVVISFKETSFPELEVNSGFLEVTLKLIIAFEIESLEILFLESFKQELNKIGKHSSISSSFFIMI